MHILVIDGQGGRIGRSLIERIKQEIPGAYVTAVGTNDMATVAMLTKPRRSNASSASTWLTTSCARTATVRLTAP